jgi:hypothetical protein
VLVVARSCDGPFIPGVAGAFVLGALASLQPAALKLPLRRTGNNQSILFMLPSFLRRSAGTAHAKWFRFAALEIKARAKSGSEQKIIYIIALTLGLNGPTDVCRIKSL